MAMVIKPPLGIKPKYIWKLQRRHELSWAMRRFLDSSFPIPTEWVTEYNELLLEENA